jgi:hypothetical protein
MGMGGDRLEVRKKGFLRFKLEHPAGASPSWDWPGGYFEYIKLMHQLVFGDIFE